MCIAEHSRNIYCNSYKRKRLHQQLQSNVNCKSSSCLSDFRKQFNVFRKFYAMVCTVRGIFLCLEHRRNYPMYNPVTSRNLYGNNNQYKWLHEQLQQSTNN